MKVFHILLTLLIITTLSVSCKKENKAAEPKWVVNISDGLRMRETPDTSGKVIVVIPDKAEVKFISEKSETVTIGSTTGKWTEIEWQGKKGWVFGGFLKKVDPNAAEAPKTFDGNYPKAANGWHLLNKLAKSWERLIDSEGKYHTFTPCMYSPETISITTDESGPSIRFNGATDSVTCRKIKIRETDEGKIIFTLDQCGTSEGEMNGEKTMTMLFLYGPEEDIFSKNECAEWDGDFFGNEPKLFVPTKNKDKFENVTEKCQ